MRNLLLGIITLLFLTSCSHRKEQRESVNEDYVTIPVPEQDINTDMSNTIPLSTFIDKIDIIPLEFDDSCILGEIRKVAICGDNIFVLESQRPGTVYRFNMQGNFSNKIGSKGQGPEEVIELSDFTVNEEEQLIYLLDNYRQTVLSCTFDGEVKEAIKINQYADQLHYKNGLFYLFYDEPVKGELYSLVVRDIHGGIKERFFPSKQYPISRTHQAFTPQEEGVLFSKPMNDTIYFLRDTEMSRLYWVDFGSLRFSPQEIEDIYMERTKSLDLLLQKNRVTSIDHVFRVGDWLCFKSLYKIIHIFFVYNIHTQELRTSVGSLYDDLEYMFYGNEFCGQTEDALIGIYDSERIMEDINQYAQHEKEGMITKEQKERFQSKMNALRRGDDTENMNPWILLYHVKKD
ncbi:MAG: 6-bladed beta-propeller [Tannerella sp.]|nr:6-bladed beta-propeller [Tannerella sp.]